MINTRFIFSIIGFALFIVGCQSLVPVTERVIELPTRDYQRTVDPTVGSSSQKDSSGLSSDKRVVEAFRESCRKHGRFSITHRNKRESYVCYPEAQ